MLVETPSFVYFGLIHRCRNGLCYIGNELRRRICPDIIFYLAGHFCVLRVDIVACRSNQDFFEKKEGVSVTEHWDLR